MAAMSESERQEQEQEQEQVEQDQKLDLVWQVVEKVADDVGCDTTEQLLENNTDDRIGRLASKHLGQLPREDLIWGLKTIKKGIEDDKPVVGGGGRYEHLEKKRRDAILQRAEKIAARAKADRRFGEGDALRESARQDQDSGRGASSATPSWGVLDRGPS